jgi:serine/threonine protein phosphatase PrpC
MNFRIYCAMEVGPRDGQEDCLLVQGEVIQAHRFDDSRRFSSDAVEILVVCDGMGGLAAGEKASRAVCESLAGLGGDPGASEDIRTTLEKIQLKMEHDGPEECGTTVAGLVVAPDRLQVFNMGDSRVYRIADGEIECRSHDHSVVQSLLDEGKITYREAFRHPYRNLITAGMGTAFSYKWAAEIIHLRTESMVSGPVVYLLCSDGVSDVLTDREIAAALGEDPVAGGPALMEHIKAVFVKDNTSFMVVELSP